MLYSNFCSELRKNEKKNNYLKKIATEKGLKEIKKNQYRERWKQNKIENLAVKNCIFNTEKYREKANLVRFIFDEDIVQGLVQGSQGKEDKNRKRPKKYISMDMEMEDKSSKRDYSLKESIKDPGF